MKRAAIALLSLVSVCWGQKPQEARPGWTAQQLQFLNLGADLNEALQAINERPKQAWEAVITEGTCGALSVYTTGTKDSKGNDVLRGMRTTFDGQKPGKIAFCWLSEVRRRFATEEIEAKRDREVETLVKDTQLAFLTEPDSVYLKVGGRLLLKRRNVLHFLNRHGCGVPCREGAS
jgi:hypothetical protein